MSSSRAILLAAAVAFGLGMWHLLQSSPGRTEPAYRPEELGSIATHPPLAVPPFVPEPSEREGHARREPPDAQPRPTSEGGTSALLLRVVAKETRRPLEGVSFELDGHHGGQARTDAEGRARLAVSPEVEHLLHVSDPGSLARPQQYLVDPLFPGEQRESEIELETSPDARWLGRVLDDENGVPLSGAILRWRVWPREEVRSGADGLLEVACRSWLPMRASIEVAGYSPAEVLIFAGEALPGSATEIRLLRPAALEVRVHEAPGAPLADLGVEVRSIRTADGGPPPAGEAQNPHLGIVSPPGRPALIFLQRRTDADGTARFEDLPARLDLEVFLRAGPRNSQRMTVVLAPRERRVVDFVAGGGCLVQGLALDGAGAPIPSLDLWRLAAAHGTASIEPESEPAVVDKARTDAGGHFEFAGVPSGDWWIGPAPYHRRDGFASLAARVSVVEGESVKPLTLVCSKGLYVRGTILGADGGPAVAEVKAERDGARLGVQSDDYGRFVIGPLSAGTWSIEASALKSGDAPSEPVLALAGGPAVLLRLQGGGGLNGRVRDEDGSLVRGATIGLVASVGGVRRAATTDPAGTFAFRGLPPGPYLLYAVHGNAAAVLQAHVDLARNSEGHDLLLAPGAELRVHRSASGAGELDLFIEWNDATLVHLPAFQVGAEHTVTFPPGRVRVRLARPSIAGAPIVLEERLLDVRRGETTRLELTGNGSQLQRPDPRRSDPLPGH